MPDATLSSDLDAFVTSANDAAARTELGLTALATTTPGTGVATALAINTGSAGAFLPNNAANPPSNDGAALGTTLLNWSDLFLASGAVVNWANGDVLLTHAANALTFTGASIYQFDSTVRPTADDAAALGAATASWADLFLASGGVINFNNGNLGLTHNNAGAFLLVNPGDLRITSANVGTNADSVPTLSSTSTLTNKTLASPTLTGTTTAATVNATTVAATNATFGGATVAVRPAVKQTAVNYTIGTTDPNELYGGVIYVTAAATITIPAVAAGASFTVITVGAVAVSVDPNAADLIVLDGVALSDGDKITNLSTAGDMAVFTYYDATGWAAQTNGWTDTN